jgi:hypothetical protein
MAVLTRAAGGRADRVLVVQRVLGVIYLVAGMAKPFGNAIAPGVPEDVGEVLLSASAANAGTPLQPVTDSLAAATPLVIAVVTVAMVALGLVYLGDGPLRRTAAAGNLAMLACFAVILARHAPWLPLIDAGLALLAVLVFVRASRWPRARSQADPRTS